MSFPNCKDKITRVLERICENRDIVDSYYYDSILQSLEDSIKNDAKYADIACLSDLVMQSITHFELLDSTFMLKLAKLAFDFALPVICSHEMKEFMMQTLQLLKAESKEVQLHLSFINFMTSLIRQDLGLLWIIEHKVWRHILDQPSFRRSMKVREASYNVLSALVWRLDQDDKEEALAEVLNFIIKPLILNERLDVEILDVDNGDELTIIENMKPFLYTLVTVLRDKDRQEKVNRTMSVLLDKYWPECRMYVIGDITKNHEVLIVITEIVFRLWCHVLQQFAENKNIDITFELLTLQNNYLYSFIYTKGPQFVLNSLVTMNILWHVSKGKMPNTYEWNGKQYEIEVQQMALVLVPMMAYVEARIRFDSLTYKLTNILSEHTVKTAYAFRDVINSQGNIKELVIHSLKQYTRLVNSITATQAGLMYEALHYVLENYGSIYKDNSVVELKNSPEDFQIINLCLDLVKTLLLKHDIHWYENVEIVRLEIILVNLLKYGDLPNRQITQTLDVIEICVRKFILPDLSLLLESRKGSVLQELGQLMATLIHHETWEIRDSTLSLLLICMEISFVKYVPMRKIIKEHKLITPMVDLALNDDEMMYIQANALKCLAATATIACLWNGTLHEHQNLVEEIMQILVKNSESLVRLEAANVLINIFVNQQVMNSFELKMYRLMAKAAIEDLQWEVQTTALNFWHHMIQKELNNAGMIDGNFPTVIFSKEKHKIVKLNDIEILKQLSNVMNKLSNSRALTVLHKCMNEDQHIQVREKANDIAKQLVTILTKYNFQTDDISHPCPVVEPEHSYVMNDCNVTLDYISKDIDDKMLDEIVSKNLSELVINLHNRERCKVEEDETAETFQHSIMNVNDFLYHFHVYDSKLSSKSADHTLFNNNDKLDIVLETLSNEITCSK